ncbi:hypothetical protein [Butyrivibrio sp. TB]|uniref:hypothetical protein n=1 Tax=Butyrivibrio sp. TB TaxID=1520809 RepID=UPI0008B8EB2D|nr:hypothetical protein [Butyrivibrio sp. TB]SEQ40567.1 hypothetical protein SAMN02910382_02921 [Butyrivibrio sp. TB]
MDYSIRFAQKSDVDKIMQFIDTYWRKGHILSRDRKLFEWQYRGDNDKLNIVIGLDEDDQIQGMLGFVTYDTSDDKDIALALWKANPSTGFLGIKLIQYLINNEPHREIVCPGINPETTSKIYAYVGMQVSTMSHWYRLARRDAYNIAKITTPPITEFVKGKSSVKLVPIDETLENVGKSIFDKSVQIPYKSRSYLLWRYFNHPQYVYKVFASVNDNEDIKALFAFRIQECNGSKALRMIDCIGDISEIKRVTPEIDRLLDEYGCEYVDTYEAGIDEKIFIEAGWHKVIEDGNIIPDYFSPFEQRNVEIHYSTSNMRAILFKGDGDQDRPS